MDYLFSFALLVHVCSALGIIGLVLVQHGKGADMGAAFRITDCRGNVIFISKIVKEGDCRTCSKPDATRGCRVKNWRMRSGEMQICISP